MAMGVPKAKSPSLLPRLRICSKFGFRAVSLRKEYDTTRRCLSGIAKLE